MYMSPTFWTPVGSAWLYNNIPARFSTKTPLSQGRFLGSPAIRYWWRIPSRAICLPSSELVLCSIVAHSPKGGVSTDQEAIMSLQPRESYPIPEETVRVARAIFPKGNLVMRLYDELGMLVQDQEFADLFPIQGQPAEAPTRLALVTLLQFMEGLTDRQAAETVRTRI